MSAFFSICAQGMVATLSDAASVDRGGVLRKIGRKIDFSRKRPVAVTTRGSALYGEKVAASIVEMVERWGFDRAMQTIEHQLPNFPIRVNDRGENQVEVLIAGWSETGGATQILFVNRASADGEVEALKFYRRAVEYGGAGFQAGDVERLGIRKPLPGEDLKSFMELIGPRIMIAMRQAPARAWRGSGWEIGQANVGGWCDLAVVTEQGVTVNKLFEWPDRISERIDPMAMPKGSDGMNRQQRRQAERNAKRGTAA